MAVQNAPWSSVRRTTIKLTSASSPRLDIDDKRFRLRNRGFAAALKVLLELPGVAVQKRTGTHSCNLQLAYISTVKCGLASKES